MPPAFLVPPGPLRAVAGAFALAFFLGGAPSLVAASGPVHAGSPNALTLREARVAEVSVALDGVTPQERARTATAALAEAFAAGARGATVAVRGERAEVVLGGRPVLLVSPEDAAAAGEPDAQALAAALAARIDLAFAEEAFRLRAQGLVYAVSMLVFSALIAVLLARRLGRLALAVAGRVEAGALRVPALSLGGVEVVGEGFMRGGVPLLLRLGRFALQVAVLYGWVVFASSLFERTRPLGERLTRALLAPAVALLAQLGQALPLAFVLAVAVAALALVLRAVRLHFEELEREAAEGRWLRPELARPTGQLVRLAIVAAALVSAPGLLGAGEGSGLRALAQAALVALGLGAAPLVASLVLGAVAVYGGGLRAGDEAEVGGRRGRVVEVTLREVVLEEEGGAVARIPHLLTLWHPTRILSPGRERR